MKYNKLVRDKIPEIIEKNGSTAVVRIAGVKEYRKLLEQKLQEEVSEFLKSGETEELADILEVIYALARVKKISPQKLEKVRVKKEKERGGFSKRIVLIKTHPHTK